jgi:hypothetical protein
MAAAPASGVNALTAISVVPTEAIVKYAVMLESVRAAHAPSAPTTAVSEAAPRSQGATVSTVRSPNTEPCTRRIA